MKLARIEEAAYNPAMLYTPAMIAELAKVPVASIRAWRRRGWLVPQEVEHGVAGFDFAQVTIARTLAGLLHAGIKPAALAKRLEEIAVHLPHVQQPLVQLTFLVDGGQLLVRHGEDILEPRGQLRMDFDSLAEEANASAAIFSPPLSAEVLTAGARELEEEGHLAAAADLYRAAMAEAGPRADLCFDLAEVLYRLGDLPAARERYFMAIELDEDHAEARANLGCLLAELGQRELAQAALEGAIACHREYADAHFHLAWLLDEAGQHADAAGHWREFLKLAPESPWQDEARTRLGE
jgi:tetratricopeptide (TPR) repeat protein